jgi:tetratricopeptide (TPR) repeat protein
VVQARIVQLQQERAANDARARVGYKGCRAVNTKLTVMPEQEPKQTPDQSLPATPEAPRPQAEGEPPEADSDLLEGRSVEEIPEGQVFVTDDDFYKSIEQIAKPPAIAEAPGKRLKFRIPRLRLSTAQKILVAGIVLIVALLLRTLLTSSSRSAAASSKSSADNVIPAAQKQPPRHDATWPGTAPQSPQATSLKVAQDFYAAGEYDNAYATYSQLYRSLPPDANSHRDLLRLKMALCRAKSGLIEEADRLLDEIAKSSSNALRLMANYHRISLEMQKKQYLNARTRAYRAMALIDVVDTDAKIKSSLRSNCHFLIAEALTKHVLSLSDLDADLTPELWGAPAEIDPFLGLDDQQLEALLNSGADYLNDALLRPQIREIRHNDGSTRWSVVANGAPIEELLARFAANADLDISWTLGSAQDPQAQGPSARSPGTGRPQRDRRDVGGSADPAHNRPVILYMPAATPQQVVAAAAGQVGLLARIDQNDVITIIQPAESSSLSQSISLLCSETISLWQRFLLSFDGDRRAANAHFALGLLHSQQGGIPEAIAEYKLTANRFPSSSLAPYALLNSSKLKSSPQVRDYAGAADDLKQVVEQYPDDRIVTRAYVYLAECTEKAGTIGEAARLYRKVYYLGFSPESQCSAALGAGKCCYQISDYDSAARWLANYIDLMREKKNPDVCSACFLLGKAYLALNEPQQACRAFQYALAGPLPRNDYVETISALTDAYIAQKQFLQALDVLENVDSYQFSQAELVRILLLKSKVLREMGLVDNAVTLLSSRIEYASDPRLKAEISFELTKCYIARNQLELAHKKLTEILVVVPPGPLAYEVSLKLAQTSLMLSQDSQAISVCSQLLDSAAPEQIKNEAAQMLATAYSRQKNYDKAALALLDRPK